MLYVVLYMKYNNGLVESDSGYIEVYTGFGGLQKALSPSVAFKI